MQLGSLETVKRTAVDDCREESVNRDNASPWRSSREHSDAYQCEKAINAHETIGTDISVLAERRIKKNHVVRWGNCHMCDIIDEGRESGERKTYVSFGMRDCRHTQKTRGKRCHVCSRTRVKVRRCEYRRGRCDLGREGERERKDDDTQLAEKSSSKIERRRARVSIDERPDKSLANYY